MKNIYLILIILILNACGNQSIRPDTPQYLGLSQAQSYYNQQEYRQSALAYSQLYDAYREQKFAILAADSWVQQGDMTKAQRQLAYVNNHDDNLYQLLNAEIQVANGNYNTDLSPIKGRYQQRYFLIAAMIDEHNNRSLDAALSYIMLSQLRNNPEDTDKIIANLLKVSENEITQSLFNNDLSNLQQGWLEARYVLNANDPNAIAEWKEKWQTHPATAFFKQNKSAANIAVLLPMSGKYKQISKDIQQGMIASLYRDDAPQQQLTFFDTGSDGQSFSYAWFGAIESGAKFIIGPLDKKSISQLNDLNNSTIPVLLLNKNDQENNGFYQFSLSQDDEVISVARRLISENKKRIVLLAPNTVKNQKLAQVFDQEFSYLGGQVVDYAFYSNKTYDYSKEIKKTMGLYQSKSRYKKLKNLLSEDLKNQTQIRPDVDAIVILAKPKQARQLKPQLKFYHAEDLPVFATSQILSKKADPARDKDLDGIKFCQNPFSLDSNHFNELINFNANNIENNKKFFAFGYDAVALNSRLEWMQRMQNQNIQGLSGQLNVDGNGLVHRDLSWGQFKKGQPYKIKSISFVIDPTLENIN